MAPVESGLKVSSRNVDGGFAQEISLKAEVCFSGAVIYHKLDSTFSEHGRRVACWLSAVMTCLNLSRDTTVYDRRKPP
nr:hypothetical protein CFP56_21924 [Quercus suber]